MFKASLQALPRLKHSAFVEIWISVILVRETYPKKKKKKKKKESVHTGSKPRLLHGNTLIKNED